MAGILRDERCVQEFLIDQQFTAIDCGLSRARTEGASQSERRAGDAATQPNFWRSSRHHEDCRNDPYESNGPHDSTRVAPVHVTDYVLTQLLDQTFTNDSS